MRHNSKTQQRDERALNVREQSYLHDYVTKRVTNNVSLRTSMTLRVPKDTEDEESWLLCVVRQTLQRLQRRHPLLRSQAKQKANASNVHEEFYFQDLGLDAEIPLRWQRTSNEDFEAQLQAEAIREMNREFKLNCEDVMARVSLILQLDNVGEASPRASQLKIGVLFSMPHFGFDGKNSLVILQEFIAFLDDTQEVTSNSKDEVVGLRTNVPVKLRDESYETWASFLLFLWELLCLALWLIWHKPKTMLERDTCPTPPTDDLSLLLHYRKLTRTETTALVSKCKQHGVSVTALLCSSCSSLVASFQASNSTPAVFGGIAADLRLRLNIPQNVNGAYSFFLLTTDTPKKDEDVWVGSQRLHNQIQTKVTNGSIFRQFPLVIPSKPTHRNTKRPEEVKKSAEMAFALSNVGVYEILTTSRVIAIADTYVLSTPSKQRLGMIEVTSITLNGELDVSFAAISPNLHPNKFYQYINQFCSSLANV